MGAGAEDTAALEAQLFARLEHIPDPEIPVLNIVEMGIVRGVVVSPKSVLVTITPTYMGCPAMDFIAEDVVRVVSEAPDFNGRTVEVKLVYSPAWTTDWLSQDARNRLEEYGISPPDRSTRGPKRCPHCHAPDTKLVSEFGSTACKAHYRCLSCDEPFEHFKCL